MATTRIDTDKLAADFVAILRQWLTAHEWATMVARNGAEASRAICHSHDFCDANMAMLEAFEKQAPMEMDSDTDQTAWNAAWDKASLALGRPSIAPTRFVVANRKR